MCPVESGSLPKIIPEGTEKVREVLMAEGKLNLILHSNSVTIPSAKIRDLVHVFIKLQNGKRGNWSCAKPA